jgi:IS5 family transposase
MKFRNHSKGGNLFSSIGHQQKMAKLQRGVLKLKKAIDWNSFRPVLEEVTGYKTKDWSKGGNLPFDPLLMFKILILQSFHGLSDEATEFHIGDRISFMNFLDIEMGDDIPDANTIWDFKELIERDQRDGSNKLFTSFRELLDAQGLVAKEGSIIDASFVETPKQRNTRDQNKQIKEGNRPEGFEKDTPKGAQKDCDARWTKKNNEAHFGYKNHAKVDAKSKLIDSYATTTASVHDSQVFEVLLDEKDKAVLSDSAYKSQTNEDILLKRNLEDFTMLKANRNSPLSDEDKIYNKKVSRIRVRVEHVLGRMKHMKLDLFRRIGIKRASQHNALCNLTYNIDRYACLQG